MRTTVIAVLFLLGAGMAQASPTDLNRCVDAQGHPVFTDKPCADMGATARVQAPAAVSDTPAKPHVHVHDCAGTATELRDGMQSALLASDVNKFASFYYWAGTSTATADAILNHLQAIVARPFVSVSLLDDRSAIEIAQTRSASDPTPVNTILPLSASMGCWWVRL